PRAACSRACTDSRPGHGRSVSSRRSGLQWRCVVTVTHLPRDAKVSVAGRTKTNSKPGRRQIPSAADGVAEMERSGALHHDRIFEHHVAADEVAEVADAGTEEHRHLAD